MTLDLPPGDEFGELGAFFNDISRQLSSDRADQGDRQQADARIHVERPEDAVAFFGPTGVLLFADAAMSGVLPSGSAGQTLSTLLAADHPVRAMVERTIETCDAQGPAQVSLQGSADDRLLLTHAIKADGVLRGVLLVARNASHLSRMQSTLAYSRKLVALGRLTAGIAHEVKNPLNAMMIHLELLRSKIGVTTAAGQQAEPVVAGSLGLSAAPTPEAESAVLAHVGVIESEIRRLDEVVQAFLKFSRPEDLQFAPVALGDLMDDVGPLLRAEGEQHGVTVETPRPGLHLTVHGDAATLRQVLMNLGLNACQAMSDGGTLRIAASALGRDRVELTVTDTGTGIPPEDLNRIFDLYFSTKDHGTGIGLSMVYRIVQMHDGEIDVESTPGAGTTFRIVLPRVDESV